MNSINIRQLREGVNFEAKTAIGGLPKSIWETYCSFANTDGGIIVLGASEKTDKSLDIVGVTNPIRMLKSLWDTLNNRAKISLNLLTEKDVTIEKLDGKDLIVIRVPRAERAVRPIFLNRDMLGSTFRRNGEGDYRCSEGEVRAMLRDADAKSQDLKTISWGTVRDLNLDSVHRYRNRMLSCRPGHVWLDLDDEQFLRRIGALAYNDDGQLRVTCAGLLMFGNEYDIVREFPGYFLDYQERLETDSRWSDRVISSSGEWSGNLYDFYFRVYNKIAQTLKVPFRMVGQDRIDDTPVHKAMREVLVNCLVNADYRLPRGVVIIRHCDSIELSNPGTFRIPIPAARSGGVSDPRNETILKMFTLIDIGERAGSGIPTIAAVWSKLQQKQIEITETFEPSRVTTCLMMPVKTLKETTVKTTQSTPQTTTQSTPQTTTQSNSASLSSKIIDVIKQNPSISAKTISVKLDISINTVREYIAKLKHQGVLQHIGPDFGGCWEVIGEVS